MQCTTSGGSVAAVVWTTVSLICLVRSLPLTTAVRQASTWERDLRTRLLLCISTIHHSPPTTPLWVGMKNQGYLVPAKNWGLAVKLYDWRAPEHQQGKGRWTHWGNSTQPQQPGSYTPKQLLLTTSPVLRAANGQIKLCSWPWRCVKSSRVPVMPGLWSSFPMSWQKEAGSLQGAWLDSDQCGLTTDSSQDPTSSHVGKGQTTVKLPVDTKGLGIRLRPQWA